MLAMLLTVGIGANPTMCNDVKSKEQVKKEKQISSAITCLGMIVSRLVLEVGTRQLKTNDRSHYIRKKQVASTIGLMALASGIGYDIWKGNRGIISAGFNQTLNAVVSNFMLSFCLGLLP